MESFFLWVQDLPVSIWISESSSLWAFPLVLFLHTAGIALTAGSSFIVTLGVLGWGPVSSRSLERLFAWFWAGFVINAISGTLLFMSAAAVTAYKVPYQMKLGLIAVGIATILPVGRFLKAMPAADFAVPARIRVYAAVSLLAWVGAIFTGRFIAYI